jgi:hypothetical protein
MRREYHLLASLPNSRKVRSSIVRLTGGCLDFFALSDTLGAISFHEVSEGGVNGDR